MKRVRKLFSTDKSGYMDEANTFIHDSLVGMGIDKKQILRNELLFEETLTRFIRHANGNSQFLVDIKRMMGEVSVTLSMKGEGFDIYSQELDEGDTSEDGMTVDAIRAVVLKAYGEKYKYGNRNGVNSVRILSDNSKKTLYTTLWGMFLGVIFGLLAKFVIPGPISTGLCSFILSPFRTMFMSALKIIIAPVVFFSIVTCFTQFDNASRFGKLGIKIVSMYFLTTTFALFLALGISMTFKPGEPGFALSGNQVMDQVNINTEANTSLIDTIVDIVPSNFLEPFLKTSTLQLILLAILCGVSLGLLGESAANLKELFESLNSLFLTITSLIAKFIPAVAFCSIALMITELKTDAFLSLLGAVMLQILSCAGIMIVYGLLILIMGRLNPLKFYKKAREGMLTGFTLTSSSAAVPTNMRVCTEKLGISPAIANFSIPLGATINMDAACMLQVILGIFLARAYGIDIPASSILPLFITIVLLSLGAPGVPGSGLLCIGIILKVLGVPVEALGLIIPIYPVLDMFDTMTNITGDMAAALIVARSENMLDLKVYNE
ncbi:MAG: dicarboxylate/amino acid:cation symporter [Lachnospiraceae bacterium]|nr:dicarboxylate/amino acid:cation symporter [Lachnospiraceae bacterium]